jgi:hypothetical protein
MKNTFLTEYQKLKESVFIAILSAFNAKIDKEAPFPSIIFTESKFVPEKAGDDEFVIGLTMYPQDNGIMLVTYDDEGHHKYPFSIESDQLTLLDLCTIHQAIA